MAPEPAGIRRLFAYRGNAQMAKKSTDSRHGGNLEPSWKMVRRPSLGGWPVFVYTRKVGEMTLQNVIRMLFGMGVALLFAGVMSIAGAIETAGF